MSSTKGDFFQTPKPPEIGPVGSTGPTGPGGATGSQGPGGATGPAPTGLSSVLVAVAGSGATATGALPFVPKAVYFVGAAANPNFQAISEGMGNGVGAGRANMLCQKLALSSDAVAAIIGLIGVLPKTDSPLDFAHLSITAMSAAGVTVTWDFPVIGYLGGSILVIG